MIRHANESEPSATLFQPADAHSRSHLLRSFIPMPPHRAPPHLLRPPDYSPTYLLYPLFPFSTPSSTPSPVPRISTPSSRPAYPFPSSSSQGLRSPLTPPQAFTTRPSLTSPTSTSPHSFPLTRNNHGMSPAGPHAAQDRATDALTRQIDEATSQLVALSDTIARARSGLVQELVEVFSVVEVGGRPPLGGKAGTKGEWTIGGLVLPVPGDIRSMYLLPWKPLAIWTASIDRKLLFDIRIPTRSYQRGPHAHASFSLPSRILSWHQAPFRSYLEPIIHSTLFEFFNRVWEPKGNGLLGVGVPWIGACKGGESGGWAWSTKQPLHVSSSPAAPSATTTPPPSSPSHPTPHSRSMTTPAPSASSPITKAISLSASSLADSQLADEPPSTSAHGSAFTTALAMLLYDVCYLAHTQAVEVPLAQAGEVLGNLWASGTRQASLAAVCHVDELTSCLVLLNRRSHATSPLLPAPTPPTFPLDFAQLLQATAANPTRPRARGTSGKAVRRTERIIEEDEDGWDLVDADVRANI
ncbi:hypothetical protein A0H81_02744 [Grifola frondosa]|uniref:Uncharacterized protein n=1 Tax=Grifola frondosa TaxID=5627 RepID=A0A1C7MKQ1_GRIFR|nr:hypothetical protein A0H81_02744 [Grifola frondosa]